MCVGPWHLQRDAKVMVSRSCGRGVGTFCAGRSIARERVTAARSSRVKVLGVGCAGRRCGQRSVTPMISPRGSKRTTAAARDQAALESARARLLYLSGLHKHAAHGWSTNRAPCAPSEQEKTGHKHTRYVCTPTATKASRRWQVWLQRTPASAWPERSRGWW